MKNKFLVFTAILVFLISVFALNVYAETNNNTYPKTVNTENYGIFITDDIKDKSESYMIVGYVSDGRLIVVDSSWSNIYVWSSDETCKELDSYDYLEFNNSLFKSFFQNNNVLTYMGESPFFAYQGETHKVKNDKPYDANTEYWRLDGGGAFSSVQDANETNVYDYYIKKKFYHITSSKYDSNKTYYKYNSDDCYYYKITEPFTDEELNDIYLIEDDYDGDLGESINYTFDQNTYNTLIGQGKKVWLSLFDDKLIANITDSNGNITHLDKNGNEIYAEYNGYNIEKNGLFTIMYNKNVIKIFDDDYNLVTQFEYNDPSKLVNEVRGVYQGDIFQINISYTNSSYMAYYFKPYSVLEGKNQTYSKGNLKFKFSGDFNLFDKLYINNNLVDSNNYTTKKGSTIIELKEDYLKTLENGEQVLTAVYKDGTKVNTKFTKTSDITEIDPSVNNEISNIIDINQTEAVIESTESVKDITPKTGEKNIIKYVISIMILAVIGISIIRLIAFIKKKNIF